MVDRTRNVVSGLDDQYDRLVEDIAARLEAGEPVDFGAICAQHPRYANKLRRVIPAMQAMFDLGLESATEASERKSRDESLSGTLGDFRIVSEIGRGGMGVVYEAEQISLQRRVALKVLPVAAALDYRHRQRFRNEVQAAAGLEHDHIIPIYGVGCDRGVHYYAMRFVEGRTLATVVQGVRAGDLPIVAKREDRDQAIRLGSDPPSRRRSAIEPDAGNDTASSTPVKNSDAAPNGPDVASSSPPSPDQASSSACRQDYIRAIAQVGIQAAEALEHAHQSGVVHRDIKPSNLIVDSRGHVWVADFGLARVESDVSLTATEELVGTIRYMSPEQATNNRRLLDYRTDIYSLGATLYELLAAAPAFPQQDRQALLQHIVERSPAPLRTRNPAVPRDLETIILKAMAKRPADRYDSAEQLADDLQCLLDGLPIRAQRPSLSERAWMACLRHRKAALASVGVILLFVVGLLAAVTLINQQRLRAIENLEMADRALRREQMLRREADQLRATAEESDFRRRQTLYLSDLNLAARALREVDLTHYTTLLNRHRPTAGEPDLRGFAWQYLWRCGHLPSVTLFAHQDYVYRVRYSPDGRWLASSGWDGVVRIYDATSGQTHVRLKPGPGAFSGLAFSPDGQRLAATGSDGKLYLWDVPSGKRRWSKKCHQSDTHHHLVAFAGGGNVIATAGATGIIRLWNLADGQARGVLNGHADAIFGLTAPKQGCRLASASRDQTVRIWDIESKQEIHYFDGHDGRLTALAYSGDGKWLASSSVDRTARIWDAERGENYRTMQHLDEVQSVAFSPNNQWLATGDRNDTIRLWRVRSEATTSPPQKNGWRIPAPLVWKAQQGRIYGLAWAADNKRLVSAGQNGTVKQWQPFADPAQRLLDLGAATPVRSATFSRGGQHLLTAGDRSICQWTLPEAQCTTRLTYKTRKNATICAMAQDQVIVANRDGSIESWDLQRGQRGRSATFASTGRRVEDSALAPDGSLLALVDWTGDVVHLLDTRAFQVVDRIPAEACHAAVFSTDGAELAVDTLDDIVIWDVERKRTTRVLKGHNSTVRDLDLGPRGNLLASGSNDRLIKLWDFHTGKELHSMPGHRGEVHAVAFSPDGKLLASGDSLGSLRVWDVRTGLQLCELERAEGHMIHQLRFSPAGNYLICVLSEGKLLLLDTSPPATMTTPAVIRGCRFAYPRPHSFFVFSKNVRPYCKTTCDTLASPSSLQIMPVPLTNAHRGSSQLKRNGRSKHHLDQARGSPCRAPGKGAIAERIVDEN